MTWSQYLRHTLLFHWRNNLAVILGVTIGTAVLVGAFVVGDSVRNSLRQMTLDRLGRVDHVLESPRFFREDVAAELAQLPEVQAEFYAIAPGLTLLSSLTHTLSADGSSTDDSASAQSLRAGKVHLLGVDERFWKMTESGQVAPPQGDGIILNSRLAGQLQAEVGQEVTLWLEIPKSIPRESLLGKRDDPAVQLTLTVQEVLPVDSGVGRFGIRPNQQLPLNAYIALPKLQEALELQAQRRSRSNPEGAPARVNTLFVSGKTPAGQAAPAADLLNDKLRSVLQLGDLDLRVVTPPDAGYVALESRRMILEQPLVETAEQWAKETGHATSPVYVYLVNELNSHKSDTSYSMYSVVAGLQWPVEFGKQKFEFVGAEPTWPLKDDEILINSWLAEDLQAQIGDPIDVKYYTVGSRGELPEVMRTFQIAGILKLDGTAAADPGLTPEVHGITDAKSLGDWEQPFEMDFKRITKRDDEYWERYKATPKAFVSLATAQNLWRSRYGELTSLRVAPKDGEDLPTLAKQLTDGVRAELSLANLGLQFSPVKATGLQASSGTTDFGGLFIGFSFFLILAAAILVQLFFRLGLEQRAKSFGLLQAVGTGPRRLQRLLLSEASVLTVIGLVLGVGGGIGFAAGMLYGLRTWWNRAVGTQFLHLSVTPFSIVMGVVITLLLCLFVLLWGIRQLRRVSVRSLLTGQSAPPVTEAPEKVSRRITRRVLIAAGCAVLILLAGLSGLLPDKPLLGPLSARVVSFFVAGMLLLYAGVGTLTAWIESDHGLAVSGRGIVGLARLGLRNSARNRSRTSQTVWLIASATFVIVAVAAGQRNPAREEPDKKSGNGGFTLVAESSRPLLFDLNSASGRSQLNLLGAKFEEVWKEAGQPHVYPFRVRPGEDASCLNLFQTRLPTILGVPQDFIDRGGFRFVGVGGENPWKQLETLRPDGSVPVYGDLNTLMYSLHKGQGDHLNVPNDEHPEHQLEIIGMLDGSVFQGVLLMAEEHFVRLFPEQAGYQYFLIESPLAQAQAVSRVLETGLEPYGFDVERVADRLADFLSVQNTYLSTFQTLGGLGLLLGTLGLAAVMLRNVWERRQELALLQAVGYRRGQVAQLIELENAALLTWGLVVGTVAALVAMLPHIWSIGADVAWSQVFLVLGAVFVTGLLAGWGAVRSATRLPVLDMLRAES